MLTSLGVDKAWITSGLLSVLWITFLIVRCYHLLAVIILIGSHKYIIPNIILIMGGMAIFSPSFQRRALWPYGDNIQMTPALHGSP